MTLVRKVVSNAAIGVGVIDDPNSFNTIAQPGCAAVIWRRKPPSSVQNWLDGLEPERSPDGRVVQRSDAVAETIEHLCDLANTPKGPELDWLKQDIVDLADRFSGMMAAPYLRLRLDVVRRNMCPKFHIDEITARLICTYRGTGTQYGISTDGEDPNRVFTTPTGAPILLRGTLWPDREPSGLLHRSPPIEGSGETRLLLVLDPVDEA